MWEKKEDEKEEGWRRGIRIVRKRRGRKEMIWRKERRRKMIGWRKKGKEEKENEKEEEKK